jgi:uncharacterized protein YcaQ
VSGSSFKRVFSDFAISSLAMSHAEAQRADTGVHAVRARQLYGGRGPRALKCSRTSNPGKRSAAWWSWSGSGNGKAALEHLYDCGLVAIAGRRGFERLYDIAERIVPQAALDAASPPREEAMKQLICLAGKVLRVGTLGAGNRMEQP